MNQMTNKDFFFCYSKSIYAFLLENGFDYITIAREPKNNRMFSLFHRSTELESMLDEYNKVRE